MAKNLVLEFPDPSHRQRKLFRLPDMADPTAKS
jgi:hypothetical protein